MEFEIDISLLSFAADPDGISLSEILSVHRNERSGWRAMEGYPIGSFYSIQCGYSNPKRILLIASRIEGEKRQILQVQVADEDQIDEYYCGS